MKDADCVAFLRWALPRLGLRWAGFRRVRRQVCKRVGRRIAELGLGEPAQYRSYLEGHPEEWSRLDACCWIPISRFYRDRRVFDELGREVLPRLAEAALARGASELRAWSAGCASGEEPFSLAILWAFALGPRFPELELRITATDVDPRLLERARRACYGPGSLKDLPPAWRERAFVSEDGVYRLRPELRDAVELRRQDIRVRLPGGSFDLVLCRNLVFTYFEAPVQRDVLARILERIVPGGALVLGSHESLPAGARGVSPWPGSVGVLRRQPRGGSASREQRARATASQRDR